MAPANRNDQFLLEQTIEAIVVDRPAPTEKAPQHLCLEKKYPARRWVVERTLGWLSKCRAILVRYDKKSSNYLGLIKLACALLWYRRLYVLSGD